MTIEYIEISWLCKHRKKIRSSQSSISINSCAEMGKTQVSLEVSLIHAKRQPSNLKGILASSLFAIQKAGIFKR